MPLRELRERRALKLKPLLAIRRTASPWTCAQRHIRTHPFLQDVSSTKVLVYPKCLVCCWTLYFSRERQLGYHSVIWVS